MKNLLILIMIISGILFGEDVDCDNQIARYLMDITINNESEGAIELVKMIDKNAYSLSGLAIDEYIKDKLADDLVGSAKSGMQRLGFYLDERNVKNIKEVIEENYKLNGFIVPYSDIIDTLIVAVEKHNGKDGALWICYDNNKTVNLIVMTIISKQNTIIVFDRFKKN